jgi:hypothetical protein
MLLVELGTGGLLLWCLVSLSGILFAGWLVVTLRSLLVLAGSSFRLVSVPALTTLPTVVGLTGRACLKCNICYTSYSELSGLMSLAPTNEESAWTGKKTSVREKINLRLGETCYMCR